MAALGTGLSCGSATAQSQPQPTGQGAVESAMTGITGSVHRAAQTARDAGVRRSSIEVAGWSMTSPTNGPTNGPTNSQTGASVELVSGVHTSHSSAPAPHGRWRVAADELHTDRLIAPRVIGPEAAIWGTTGRLVENGAVIEDAVVSTRHHTVRAARAELTLHPYSIKLIEVGTPVQRAE